MTLKKNVRYLFILRSGLFKFKLAGPEQQHFYIHTQSISSKITDKMIMDSSVRNIIKNIKAENNKLLGLYRDCPSLITAPEWRDILDFVQTLAVAKNYLYLNGCLNLINHHIEPDEEEQEEEEPVCLDIKEVESEEGEPWESKQSIVIEAENFTDKEDGSQQQEDVRANINSKQRQHQSQQEELEMQNQRGQIQHSSVQEEEAWAVVQKRSRSTRQTEEELYNQLRQTAHFSQEDLDQKREPQYYQQRNQLDSDRRMSTQSGQNSLTNENKIGNQYSEGGSLTMNPQAQQGGGLSIKSKLMEKLMQEKEKKSSQRHSRKIQRPDYKSQGIHNPATSKQGPVAQSHIPKPPLVSEDKKLRARGFR